MQLPGGELFLEGLIDALLALDTALADKLGTDNERLEMLAVTVQREMLAGHAGEYEFLDMVGKHRVQALSFQPRLSRLNVSSETAAKQATTTSRLVSGGTSETPKKP